MRWADMGGMLLATPFVVLGIIAFYSGLRVSARMLFRCCTIIADIFGDSVEDEQDMDERR